MSGKILKNRIGFHWFVVCLFRSPRKLFTLLETSYNLPLKGCKNRPRRKPTLTQGINFQWNHLQKPVIFKPVVKCLTMELLNIFNDISWGSYPTFLIMCKHKWLSLNALLFKDWIIVHSILPLYPEHTSHIHVLVYFLLIIGMYIEHWTGSSIF